MMKAGVWTYEDEATRVRVAPETAVELTSDTRNEVWIAPYNGGADPGIGTYSRPYRVGTADDFDSLLKNARRKSVADGEPGVRFRLTAGRFMTRGTWAYEEEDYAMLRGADELMGDGSNRTELALVNPVLETGGRRRPDANILWVGSPYRADTQGNRVQGIKLSSAHVLTTNGLRVHGAGALVEDVLVTGADGSYIPVAGPSGEIPYEAFGISFGPGGTGDVVRCRVVQRRPGSYLSAFSANVGRSRFADCSAEGMWEGPAHAAFTIYRTTTVEGCRAYGFAYGVYNDTDNVLGCRVGRCDMQVSYAAVSLVATGGEVKRGVRVSECNFAFLPTAANSTTPFVGLQLRGVGGAFKNIAVVDCTFETPSKGRKFYAASTDAVEVEAVEMERNVFPSGALLDRRAKELVRLSWVRDWDGLHFIPTLEVA